jgi:Spy/CpxP family protein refolding chaperone
MNRKTRLTLAAVAALFVGLLAFGTWRCMGWMVDSRMTQGQGSLWASGTWPKLLNLTDAQRSQIQPLEKSLRADMNRLKDELAQKQIALCDLMMSPGEPDLKTLDKTAADIASLQMEKEKKTLAHLMSLRRVLTTEQQKTLFTTMMMDICQGCRAATGGRKDHCGHCKL